jgi:hypothetical protein
MLPVVGNGGKWGVATDRDICIVMGNTKPLAENLQATKNVHCKPEDEIHEAMYTMVENTSADCPL